MIKHIHVIECDSTQDLLKEQLSSMQSSEQFLLSCDNQTFGHGRGGNSWTSLPGSLCFSFTLIPHKISSFTALEISLLVVRFFEIKGQKLKLKWPNDLWTKDRLKCGGILVQSSHDNYLAGVGINLFSEDKTFGGIYESSFEIEKKKWCFDLTQFIHLHRYEDTSLLISDWENFCGHMKMEVTIIENGKEVQGEFLGLGIYGEARLLSQDKIHHFFNGSLRPTSFAR